MILYSNRQRELLAQVAAQLPVASRAEFHQFVESQLADDIAPLDTEVFNAVRLALDRVRTHSLACEPH
jgi:hypothetical protein